MKNVNLFCSSMIKPNSCNFISKSCRYYTSTMFPQLPKNLSEIGRPVVSSFHKRPLPPNLIALSSSEGKKLFREALAEGSMECFFPLAEQFVTQSEPSYCSVSSLVMVLNALSFDPKKIWKGAWRWVSEEMLHCETEAICGHSLEKVKKHGLNFTEFESLARCHGVKIESKRACHASSESCGSDGLDEFRQLVETVSRTDQAKTFLIANYSRKYLNQTGDFIVSLLFDDNLCFHLL
jgi:glutathione gamma-glutamylcysteinyltransferase